MWQSLILTKLHPIFEYLPVENIVFQNQQQYYDAIRQSSKASDSGVFIEFMLAEILTTLKKRQGAALENNENGTVNGTVKLIRLNPKITLEELADQLNKSRRTVSRTIKKLQEDGIISRIGSDKAGYWQVN